MRIFEHTRAHRITPGLVSCDRGSIHTEQIVIATEGYSESGNPLHRRMIPVQTGMVATEPLSEKQWSKLGFHHNETFADCTRAATYLQRTADQRLVIGARGHYLPGGLPQHTLADSSAMRQTREGIALGAVPAIVRGQVYAQLGGSVGVPRGWHPHVVHDAHSRLATAGGYIGEGVGASFYSGRRWQNS